MKILERINLILFTILVIKIGFRELKDIYSNKEIGFFNKIWKHYDNFWNIFDGILLTSCALFVIIQLYWIFD